MCRVDCSVLASMYLPIAAVADIRSYSNCQLAAVTMLIMPSLVTSYSRLSSIGSFRLVIKVWVGWRWLVISVVGGFATWLTGMRSCVWGSDGAFQLLLLSLFWSLLNLEAVRLSNLTLECTGSVLMTAYCCFSSTFSLVGALRSLAAFECTQTIGTCCWRRVPVTY